MTLKAVAIFTSITFSTFTFGCEKPQIPAMPDPDTAVTAQMIKAKNDMKAFIYAAEGYLECVSKDTAKHNVMVDEMQAAADTFNKIVRKYKSRMEG